MQNYTIVKSSYPEVIKAEAETFEFVLFVDENPDNPVETYDLIGEFHIPMDDGHGFTYFGKQNYRDWNDFYYQFMEYVDVEDEEVEVHIGSVYGLWIPVQVSYNKYTGTSFKMTLGTIYNLKQNKTIPKTSLAPQEEDDTNIHPSGWIYIDPEKLAKYKDINKLIADIQRDCETVSSYLSGEVYGYVIHDYLEGENGENKIDGVTGFYGNDMISNGLIATVEEIHPAYADTIKAIINEI